MDLDADPELGNFLNYSKKVWFRSKFESGSGPIGRARTRIGIRIGIGVQDSGMDVDTFGVDPDQDADMGTDPKPVSFLSMGRTRIRTLLERQEFGAWIRVWIGIQSRGFNPGLGTGTCYGPGFRFGSGYGSGAGKVSA